MEEKQINLIGRDTILNLPSFAYCCGVGKNVFGPS
jgi:hypothetical protein